VTILLIGYRGSGKTSVGKLLAAKLGVEFVDTDQLVVMRAGKTIKEIFELQGESAFRDLESAVLEDAIRWLDDRVIATGGGMVLRESNRKLMLASGAYRVYLKSDPATLHARIQADLATAESRPALTSLGGSVEEVRQVLAQREPLYDEVKSFHINVTHLSVEQVTKMILAEIQSDSGRCFPG
jgi:shikimate kinase